MTSAKPYLIRAIYEWIADNECTPYISVDTTFPNVDVPQQYIKDNTIVLDISPDATDQLIINNDTITFKARFSGIAHEIYIPIPAVIAIYAAENTQGMSFPIEEYPADEDRSPDEPPKQDKPKLQIITGGKD